MKISLNEILSNSEQVHKDIEGIKGSLKVADDLVVKLNRGIPDERTLLKEILNEDELNFILDDINEAIFDGIEFKGMKICRNSIDINNDDLVKFAGDKKDFIAEFIENIISKYEVIIQIIENTDIVTMQDLLDINSEASEMYDYLHNFKYQDIDEDITIHYNVDNIADGIENSIYSLIESCKKEIRKMTDIA